ncbi:MAG: hypothetical protein MO846_12205 [Candidatus Devosia symbiotica]|nr:hypothetical protein [Candidatus Devosia symbiotica]
MLNLAGKAAVILVVDDDALINLNAVLAARHRSAISALLATGYSELPGDVQIDLPRLSKPYQQSDMASHLLTLLSEPELAAL